MSSTNVDILGCGSESEWTTYIWKTPGNASIRESDVMKELYEQPYVQACISAQFISNQTTVGLKKSKRKGRVDTLQEVQQVCGCVSER